MTFDDADHLNIIKPDVSERFKFGAPKHADGFVYGFLFRLLIAVLAVIVPVPIFFVAGLLHGNSQPTSFELVLFGGFIALTILIGEHLRSLVYERTIVRRQQAARRAGRSLDEVVRDLGTARHGGASPIIKRAFDVVLATAALVALAPVLIATTLLVALDSRGSIVDRERRLGINGRLIELFRFRTTRQDGTTTAVGDFVRNSSINELPLLLNVLQGDMSVVGRSLYLIDDFHSRVVTDEASIRGIKPGLITLPSLMGHRLNIPNRIAADMYYINHSSLRLDLKMIVAVPLMILANKHYY